MIRRKKLFILGLGIFLSGLLVMAPTLYYRTKDYAAANHFQTQTTIPAPQLKSSPTLVSGKPIELILDDLKLKLIVTDGVYNNLTGQWSLSTNKAHYALLSTVPNNEEGNTLIYGHYRPEVFARLKRVQPGNEAIVLTDNGYRFIYRFRSTQAVNPTDTSIFAYRGAPMLTLQTCSGAWMQNRQLYSFDLFRFEKI